MLCLIRTSLRLCGIAHIKKRDVTSIKGRVYPGVIKEPFEESFLSEFIIQYFTYLFDYYSNLSFAFKDKNICVNFIF